ncbi:MAG: hypothetical protein ACKO96_33940, partial [Flammeovirgaceae bacterium]
MRAVAVPVSGPLTDTQLRNSAVPVSGPLTDAQLRASVVPISGTVSLSTSNINHDAGGRIRVSQLTTLGDYKILGADKTFLIESAGTGTGTYGSNKFNMSVTSGQWYVRQSKRYHPYFSGKSQFCEFTFDNFQPETNVNKKVGYFSSSAVSPFNSVYDGFWLESGEG